MKRIFLTALLIFSFNSINAQQKLNLQECYTKARENYPLIKQKDYIAKTMDYSVSNVWKGYFPQISINAQATYQSDVTTIPIPSMGTGYETLSQDQYKAVADVSQVIYDGGMMGSQSDVQTSLASADDQKIEVELLKVKERVNQIYFGVLLLDEQLVQINLVKNDLDESLAKLKAALQNGTAIKSNVDVMKAELLKTRQKEIELAASRRAYITMLGLLMNEELDESIQLELPNISTDYYQTEINRPELKMYSFQQSAIENQDGLTTSKILPKLSLFFQGGYGKPTYNMLKNDFGWFYITGAKFSLPLSNLYTHSNESEINEINKMSIDSQKESFLLNTNILMKQQIIEIDKLNELINLDKEIVDLRTSVKEAAKAQLDNGVITSSDFIRELNAEDSARQNEAIHKVQLLMAQYNYQIITGN